MWSNNITAQNKWCIMDPMNKENYYLMLNRNTFSVLRWDHKRLICICSSFLFSYYDHVTPVKPSFCRQTSNRHDEQSSSNICRRCFSEVKTCICSLRKSVANVHQCHRTAAQLAKRGVWVRCLKYWLLNIQCAGFGDGNADKMNWKQ